MRHHSLIVRSIVVLACFVGIVACSDDDTASTPSASNSCTGARLTDEQLCKLTCKTTKPSEVTAILGTPQASSSSNGTQLNEYSYSCVEGNTASLITWDLYFSSDVLQSVDITSVGSFAGAALPACIASCRIGG